MEFVNCYEIIIDDLRMKRSGPMKLYCVNKSAINIVHNPVQHADFIKEKLDSGLISTPYVLSCDQLASVLTKGFPTTLSREITSKLGMEDIHSPT